MRLAIVGCGFVADLYMLTLRLHPELEVVGVMDRDPVRAARFAGHYGFATYRSLAAVLADPQVELILNLTNPASHYEVSRAALEGGKHVYAEKPMAMRAEDAFALVALARARGLRISGAPSRVLAGPAQTMWKALRDGRIGTPYLAYAEMDDGLLHRMAFRSWRGASGAPWPYRDELEVGNTLEHAGYALTWLVTFFGPVESLSAFGAHAVADKRVDVPLARQAPDFTSACLRFVSGMIARLTCSIVGDHDHQIRIFGEDGVLSTDDCWTPRSPVRLKRRVTLGGRTMDLPWTTQLPLLGDDAARTRASRGLKKVDFCLGPVELVRAITDERPSRLSPELCLHVTEIALGIHTAAETRREVTIRSRFTAPEPMPFAR
jgi:predicted dehydrogenase